MMILFGKARKIAWGILWVSGLFVYQPHVAGATANAQKLYPDHNVSIEPLKNWVWYTPQPPQPNILWQPLLVTPDADLKHWHIKLQTLPQSLPPFGKVLPWPFLVTGHVDLTDVARQLQQHDPEKIRAYGRRLGLDGLQTLDFVVAQEPEDVLRLESSWLTKPSVDGFLGALGAPLPLALMRTKTSNQVALSIVPAKLMNAALLWLSWLRPIETTLFWTQLMAFEEEAHVSVANEGLGYHAQMWQIAWEKFDATSAQVVATLPVQNTHQTFKALVWFFHIMHDLGLPITVEPRAFASFQGLQVTYKRQRQSYSWFVASTSQAIVVAQTPQALQAQLQSLDKGRIFVEEKKPPDNHVALGHVVLDARLWQRLPFAHAWPGSKKTSRTLSWALSGKDAQWQLACTLQPTSQSAF